MADLRATKDVERIMVDLHNGLHAAMEALINQKDYQRAEEMMRRMDVMFSNTINNMKVAG